MNILKIIVVLFICIGIQCCSLMNHSKILKFKQLSYGEIRASGTKIEIDKEGKSASSNTVAHQLFEISKVTDTINGKIGQVFGIKFKIIAKETKEIELTRIWTFPKKLTNPFGKEINSVCRKDFLITNTEQWMYYTIETESEIMEGVWTLQYFYQGKEIYKKSFIMKK